MPDPNNPRTKRAVNEETEERGISSNRHSTRGYDLHYDDDGIHPDEFTTNYAAETAAYDEEAESRRDTEES